MEFTYKRKPAKKLILGKIDFNSCSEFFLNRADFLRSLLSLVLVLCSLFSIAQVPSNVPTNGLVSYWPFNGDANDESGNGNHLITNGAPSFTSNASSNINSAALFPNGNDYYTTPTSSWSLINNFSNGTVSFWVNINSAYVSNHYFGIGNSFIVKQKHGCCADLFFGMLDGTTKLRFGVHNSFPNSTDLIGNTSLIPNNWYHVVGTWDGVTVKLYVNGVIDNTLTSNVGMSNMTNPSFFSIGSCAYGGNGSTNFPSGTYGALDDIGIWNRALTQQEITDLYNSCASNTATDIQAACDSYTWIDGNTYTASNNIATDTLTNVAGCDSIVTLDLTINNSTTSTDTQVACGTYTWLDGNTYTASNTTATWTTTNAAGCDNVATLNLTINNSTTSTDTQVACDAYTWLDGNTYTASNTTATFTTTNAAGCDNVATLNLTINNATTSTDTQVACDTYTWLDGNTYTASNNIATDTLTNVAGCDSLVTLDLTITGSPIVTITQIGADLEVTLGDTYLWSTTEITQLITPDTNATYWCIVTDVNGCVSDTAFFNVTYVGIDDVVSIRGLMIYPNPSGDIFNISFNSQDRQTVEIKVLNIIGKVIFIEDETDFIGEYTHQFNLKDYNKGIYFLEIKTKNGSINQKLILQ